MRKLSLLLLLCSFAAACGGVPATDGPDAMMPPPPPPECTDGAQCDFDGTPGVCAAGHCGACDASDACASAYGAGFACVEGECVMPPPPEPDCTHDDDCDSGQICSGGACVAAPSCTLDTQCGAGEKCCAGSGGNSCMDVACCDDSDCTGAGQTCHAGACVVLDAGCSDPQPGSGGVLTYHVDPTYSGSSTGSSSCPFKSLHKAFSTIRNDDHDGDSTVSIKDGATIDSTTEGADEFPLSVPAYTRVHTESGATANAKIIAPAGTTAFDVKYGGTGTTRDYDVEIDHLEIKQSTQGTSGTGVRITGGNSTKRVQVDHVEIHNFDYGIKVEEGGYAAINWGVDSHDNSGDGLRVTGGHAVVSVGSDSDEKTHFDSNNYGIYVNDDAGSALEVYGALDASGDRTVTASDNLTTGIHLSSDSDANTIQYVAVKRNGENGLGLYGGAHVKVRNCNIADNIGNGIRVKDNGGLTSVEDIDLGKSDSSDWGYNTISGSGGAHLCVESTYDGTTLHAKGNTFSTLDCSASSPDGSVNWWDSCDGVGGGVSDLYVPFIGRTKIANCDWHYN